MGQAMTCTKYVEAVHYLQEIREDIRFKRDLSWSIIEQQGTFIVDSVREQSNMLNLLKTLEGIGEYEFVHPIKVATIAVYIGKWLHMDDSDLFALACAGLVADIGKAKIKDSLLYKASDLNNDERELMRQHSIKGFGLIAKDKRIAGGVKMAVLSHHERADGSGYPFGLKNDEIHIFAKIIAVADIFDAMISDRIYSKKISVFHAVREIFENGFGKLDPLICQTFFQKICKCYIGTKVVLSNDMIGEIVYINPLHPERPLIRSEQKFFDLITHKDIEIIDLI